MQCWRSVGVSHIWCELTVDAITFKIKIDPGAIITKEQFLTNAIEMKKQWWYRFCTIKFADEAKLVF